MHQWLPEVNPGGKSSCGWTGSADRHCRLNLGRGASRTLRVRVDAASRPIQIILLGASDNLGRPVRLTGSVAQSDATYEFGVNWPSDAASVDLTLAVQQTRWVEFSVPASSTEPIVR